MSYIFISYSRRDLDVGQKIIDALARNKLDTWIDWKSIPKGEDWEQEIYRGIEQADAFLFLISPASVTSEMCNKEIAHAVKNGKRILPIFIANVDNQQVYGVTEKFRGQEQKEEINRRNFIFCREARDDFDKAMEEIKKTIRTDYEWLRYHTALQVEALEWEHHKDVSRLFRGKELREAEYQLAVSGSQKDPPPTQLQRQFILASQRNEVRIRRQITSGLVVGLVIMLILSFVAWGQRNSAVAAQATAEANAKEAERQAKIARAGELAAQSSERQEENFPVSILLACEAFRTSNTVRSRGALLDAANANPLLRQYIEGNTGSVKSIAFNPDGRTLASGGCANAEDSVPCKGEIILWDLAANPPTSQLLIGDTSFVVSIAFSPDGRTLASGYEDGRIILWDLTASPVTSQFLIGHTDPVTIVAFSPHSKFLASGYEDGKVILWDLTASPPTDQLLRESVGSKTTIAFSRDLKHLAVGTEDGTILLSDLAANSPTDQRLAGQTGHPVTALAFSPDGSTLASSGDDIILWDISTGLYSALQRPNSAETSIFSIAFSPDGSMFAAGSSDHTVILLDVNSDQTGQPPSITGEKSLTGHIGPVVSVAFSPDGKTLASGGDDIILWDVKTRQSIGQHLNEYIQNDEDTQKVASIAFSPDGKTKTLASGYQDGTIKLWNLTANPPTSQFFTGHTGPVTRVAFSPDGRTLASGGCAKAEDSVACKGEIKLWDLTAKPPTDRLLTEHTEYTDSVTSVAFSPDGKTLAAGTDDGMIILWDLMANPPTSQFLLGHKRFVSISFSPDSRTLASRGLNETIMLWDLADSPPTSQLLQKNEGGASIAFSPNGKILVSGGKADTVTWWDVSAAPITLMETHKFLGLRLGGGPMFTTSVAFSPDGETLAAGGDDGTIILWDVDTRQPIAQPFMDPSSVLDIAFSADGQTLASADLDGPIILWDVSPEAWVERACQRVGRNFTRGEWDQYFSPNEEYRKTCEEWPLELELTPAP